MQQKIHERVNMTKVSSYAIIANALQILFAVGIFAYALLAPNFMLAGIAEKLLVGVMTLVVVWGAALDIREAFTARKVALESRMIEDALRQLEGLNGTLRAQRHDFMNHLQVVYSLMEMQEYTPAQEYIERVYGDIQRVGRTLKTAIPAVNALLAAKEADCAEKHISLELEFNSAWQGIPMPGWELCRVLGNLIDNAVDALLGAETKPAEGMRIRVTIGEDMHAFTFSVSNNGPEIPHEIQKNVFQMGFTTKSSGRGMGLHIVSELMRTYDGSIQLTSEGDKTCFAGTLPKPALSEIPGSDA